MAPRHSLTDTYRSMAHLRRFFESVRRTITTEPTNGGLTPAQQFALLTLAGNPSTVHGRRREGPARGRRRTGKSAVARRVRNVVRQLGRRHQRALFEWSPTAPRTRRETALARLGSLLPLVAHLGEQGIAHMGDQAVKDVFHLPEGRIREDLLERREALQVDLDQSLRR